MDFIRPIDHPSRQKRYVILCTYYLTKWAGKNAVKETTENNVVEFLRDNIFYKFIFSRELVIDQGAQFTSSLIEYLVKQHHIKHNISSYHPQENGMVEVTNRALENILTKVVLSSRKCLVDRLVESTQAYNTTWKTTTRFTPFELVYGKNAQFFIKFEYNTLRMEAHLYLDLTTTQQQRILQLNGLDEFRMQCLLHTKVIQLQIFHMINTSKKGIFKKEIVLCYMVQNSRISRES